MDIAAVDRRDSLVVFISHNRLRSHEGAYGLVVSRILRTPVPINSSWRELRK